MLFGFKGDHDMTRRFYVYLLLIGLIGLVIGYILGNIHPLTTSEKSIELGYVGNGYTHIVDLQTGKDTNIGNPGLNTTRASPDGAWIAAWSQEQGRWQLDILSTSTWQRETLGAFDIYFPTLAWSPDSSEIVFAAIPEGKANSDQNEELFFIKRETQQLQQLTDNTYDDAQADFSPDGRFLAYKSSEDGFNRLYVMEVATHEHHLVTDKAFGYVPAWSPDSKQIAFSSNHEDLHGEIYVIDADGQNLRRITHNDVSDEQPFWLP